ncbi:hypothetical protein KIN20_015371 [Parelaphostrongylus tenuis]|uniref:Uncharacterized protein n=1 Tax=Parelaphostrongylus tenuis TaxID=148309 RepID=A0AAD5QPW5_PARTN|nr:hypothetical protein KIN20_015371 [Parelaphostrongylus tenuis]
MQFRLRRRSYNQLRTTNLDEDKAILRMSYGENAINSTATHLHIRRGRPNYQKFTFEDLFSRKISVQESYATAWTQNGGLILTKNEFFEAFEINFCSDRSGECGERNRAFVKRIYK